MKVTKEFLEQLKGKCGASNCAWIQVKDIVLDPGLRKNCELNYCGEYGRTWVCPPHCGPIEECIQKVGQYEQAVIIQTISPLEDSYDFEGMEEAAVNFGKVLLNAVKVIRETAGDQDMLVLSAGGCHRRPSCAAMGSAPCRPPEGAFPSLVSHGIFVSDLAAKAGLNYINGQNTVTYFGAVFM